MRERASTGRDGHTDRHAVLCRRGENTAEFCWSAPQVTTLHGSLPFVTCAADPTRPDGTGALPPRVWGPVRALPCQSHADRPRGNAAPLPDTIGRRLAVLSRAADWCSIPRDRRRRPVSFRQQLTRAARASGETFPSVYGAGRCPSYPPLTRCSAPICFHYCSIILASSIFMPLCVTNDVWRVDDLPLFPHTMMNTLFPFWHGELPMLTEYVRPRSCAVSRFLLLFYNTMCRPASCISNRR